MKLHLHIWLQIKSTGQARMNGNYIIAKNKNLVPKMREETSIYLNKYKLTSTVYGHVHFMGTYCSKSTG